MAKHLGLKEPSLVDSGVNRKEARFGGDFGCLVSDVAFVWEGSCSDESRLFLCQCYARIEKVEDEWCYFR